LARENVQNEHNAHLKYAQLLITAYNRLACTSGISTGKQTLKCVTAQYTYCTNEQAEDYCLVLYEKRQCRLAEWC